MASSDKNDPYLRFDTELFKFFKKGETEKTLPNWKLKFTTTESRTGPYWARWNEDIELFRKEKDGSWTSYGKRSPTHFCKTWMEDDNWSAKDWKKWNSLMTPAVVRSLREEIEEVYEQQRRERNRELAKKRKAKDEALAKVKGVAVEDVVFERTSKRIVKSIEKGSEKNMQQVKLSFEYAKYLDQLEREAKRCRAILESPDIHRLKLRAGEEGLRVRVHKCIATMQNYFQQIPEKGEK